MRLPGQAVVRPFTEVELKRSLQVRFIAGALSLVAILFGIVTVIAGTRVLAGSDPGYSVFFPLLLYNTAMGVAYMVAGVTAWRNFNRDNCAAAAIFVLNFFVLGIVSYLYTAGTAVAVESVHAMIFRTGVWFAIFLGLAWVRRMEILTGDQHA